jgi:hypothetical protein
VESARLWTRLRRTIVAAAAAAILALCLAAPAGARLAPGRPEKSREAEQPQYVIPDIIAALVCVSALAVPCKRFRRT